MIIAHRILFLKHYIAHYLAVVSIMRKKHRRKIEGSRKDLVQTMLPDEVITNLRSKFVLQPNEADELDTLGRREGKNKKIGALLDLIMRKDDKAFKELYKALKETGQKHVADLLRTPAKRKLPDAGDSARK